MPLTAAQVLANPALLTINHSKTSFNYLNSNTGAVLFEGTSLDSKLGYMDPSLVTCLRDPSIALAKQYCQFMAKHPDLTSTSTTTRFNSHVMQLKVWIGQLDAIKALWQDILFTFTQAQWHYLELEAFLEYMKVCQPLLNSEDYGKILLPAALLISAITNKVVVIEEFAKAGVPIWLICLIEQFTEETCIDTVITPFPAEALDIEMGPWATDDLQRHNNLMLFSWQFLSYTNFGQTSSGPPTLLPPNKRKHKMFKPHINLSQHDLNHFKPNPNPMAPIMMEAWVHGLSTITVKKENVCLNFAEGDNSYIFPPTSVFLPIQADGKLKPCQLKILHTYLMHTNILILRLSPHNLPISLLRGSWDLLLGPEWTNSNSTPPSTTSAAKERDEPKQNKQRTDRIAVHRRDMQTILAEWMNEYNHKDNAHNESLVCFKGEGGADHTSMRYMMAWSGLSSPNNNEQHQYVPQQNHQSSSYPVLTSLLQSALAIEMWVRKDAWDITFMDMGQWLRLMLRGSETPGWTQLKSFDMICGGMDFILDPLPNAMPAKDLAPYLNGLRRLSNYVIFFPNPFQLWWLLDKRNILSYVTHCSVDLTDALGKFPAAVGFKDMEELHKMNVDLKSIVIKRTMGASSNHVWKVDDKNSARQVLKRVKDDMKKMKEMWQTANPTIPRPHYFFQPLIQKMQQKVDLHGWYMWEWVPNGVCGACKLHPIGKAMCWRCGQSTNTIHDIQLGAMSHSGWICMAFSDFVASPQISSTNSSRGRKKIGAGERNLWSDLRVFARLDISVFRIENGQYSFWYTQGGREDIVVNETNSWLAYQVDDHLEVLSQCMAFEFPEKVDKINDMAISIHSTLIAAYSTEPEDEDEIIRSVKIDWTVTQVVAG
ncbi:hypothetical protein BDN71DRAFT_1435360 [Pleurotus eryngii]|uniref:Uncharacterized protein n=1 Tax=Pleurotus eryngii TaxID=5323 RepID=A0A9P5ZPH4_PLEER|nr:hypothetical protein BDN71DRAFT_1435360 [Pleurotus eryngii]